MLERRLTQVARRSAEYGCITSWNSTGSSRDHQQDTTSLGQGADASYDRLQQTKRSGEQPTPKWLLVVNTGHRLEARSWRLEAVPRNEKGKDMCPSTNPRRPLRADRYPACGLVSAGMARTLEPAFAMSLQSLSLQNIIAGGQALRDRSIVGGSSSNDCAQSAAFGCLCGCWVLTAWTTGKPVGLHHGSAAKFQPIRASPSLTHLRLVTPDVVRLLGGHVRCIGINSSTAPPCCGPPPLWCRLCTR